MSEPKDRKEFTERDSAALARLFDKPPPPHLMDKVMKGISKDAPTKRNLTPELPRKSPPAPRNIQKGREKDR